MSYQKPCFAGRLLAVVTGSGLSRSLRTGRKARIPMDKPAM